MTDFNVAFGAAFDMFETTLNEGETSGCQVRPRGAGRRDEAAPQRAILFLTDGIADDPSDLIKTRNTELINARVFSYALSDDALATWRAAVEQLLGTEPAAEGKEKRSCVARSRGARSRKS